jgi:hypothetical protein
MASLPGKLAGFSTEVPQYQLTVELLFEQQREELLPCRRASELQVYASY